MPWRRRMVKNCFLSCTILVLSGCGGTSDVLVRTEIHPCPPKAIAFECPVAPDQAIPLGERLDKLEEREECLLDWLALWHAGWTICFDSK